MNNTKKYLSYISFNCNEMLRQVSECQRKHKKIELNPVNLNALIAHVSSLLQSCDELSLNKYPALSLLLSLKEKIIDI